MDLKEAQPASDTATQIAQLASFTKVTYSLNCQRCGKVLHSEDAWLRLCVDCDVCAGRSWTALTAQEPEARDLTEDVRNKHYLLAVDAKGRMSVGYCYRYQTGELGWVFAKPIGAVTHWMQLPDAPSVPEAPESYSATSVSSPRDSSSPEIVIQSLCKAVRRAVESLQEIKLSADGMVCTPCDCAEKEVNNSLQDIASILEGKDA